MLKVVADHPSVLTRSPTGRTQTRVSARGRGGFWETLHSVRGFTQNHQALGQNSRGKSLAGHRPSDQTGKSRWNGGHKVHRRSGAGGEGREAKLKVTPGQRDNKAQVKHVKESTKDVRGGKQRSEASEGTSRGEESLKNKEEGRPARLSFKPSADFNSAKT